MRIEERPTDMLVRQLAANRKAARTWIDNGQGRRWRHFCHLDQYRPHFVREIIAMRRELKRRDAAKEPEGGKDG